MKNHSRTDLLTLILGLGFSSVGAFAFLVPETFFSLLGDYYGEFNLHFVKDAGISFFACGVLLLMSLSIKAWQVPLTLGGSLFIILHGLFHVQMLVMGMIPSVFGIVIELIVIISPSILTGILLFLRIKQTRL